MDEKWIDEKVGLVLNANARCNVAFPCNVPDLITGNWTNDDKEAVFRVIKGWTPERYADVLRIAVECAAELDDREWLTAVVNEMVDEAWQEVVMFNDPPQELATILRRLHRPWYVRLADSISNLAARLNYATLNLLRR